MKNTSNNAMRFPNSFNVFETLRDVSGEKTKEIKKNAKNKIKKSIKNAITQTPQQFLQELVTFGSEKSPLMDLQTISADKEAEKNKNFRKSIALERKMRKEDEARSHARTQELQMQLRQIQEEIVVITHQSNEFSETTKLVAMQVIVEPSIYHKSFFENVLHEVRKFSKQIQHANLWLHSFNARSSKKGWVENYKQSGAKYLLSGEHYLTRSAG